jgi:hypothetical protein
VWLGLAGFWAQCLALNYVNLGRLISNLEIGFDKGTEYNRAGQSRIHISI